VALKRARIQIAIVKFKKNIVKILSIFKKILSNFVSYMLLKFELGIGAYMQLCEQK
jgi:hypothetical protein